MKTAIIIPCYNEFRRLSIDKIISFVKNQPDIDLYMVNDGSTDQTINILNNLHREYPQQIHVIELKKNEGKAEAVRRGMLAANSEKKYQYFMFLDADFSTSLEECLRFIDYADMDKNVKVVCGCRIKRMGAEIYRTAKRHYFGRVFATLTYFVFPFPMYDTQCGAKFFRSEVIEMAFSQPFATKWLFDIEILLRLSSSFGYERSLREIYEIPLLKWIQIDGSKMGFMSFFILPFELVKIYVKYKQQINDLKKNLRR